MLNKSHTKLALFSQGLGSVFCPLPIIHSQPIAPFPPTNSQDKMHVLAFNCVGIGRRMQHRETTSTRHTGYASMYRGYPNTSQSVTVATCACCCSVIHINTPQMCCKIEITICMTQIAGSSTSLSAPESDARSGRALSAEIFFPSACICCIVNSARRCKTDWACLDDVSIITSAPRCMCTSLVCTNFPASTHAQFVTNRPLEPFIFT
jgi:hypothetical protein